MKELYIGIIQMKVTDDKEKNIRKAEGMIKESVMAVSSIVRDRSKFSKKTDEFLQEEMVKRPELVILPEMFNCPYQSDLFPEYAEEEGGYTYQHLSRIARENQIYLVGGSIPEREDDMIFNTSYIFNREGERIGKHRKIHLFDIDIEGGQTFKESDTLSSGNNIEVVETEIGKIGIIICYDLRFPELSRLLVNRGAELIVVPGAFNMTTGPAHWEILFRTRALDNQVFMLGAAPARDEDSSYVSYGNSIVVDPWGRVLNKLDKEEGIIVETINIELLEKIREELPLLKHRRTDLYDLKEISGFSG
ncbi:MAG: carbon-nitrogen hydrolase family protein [Halanaerobiales bacterium]